MLKVVDRVTKGEGGPLVEANLDSILGLINIVDFGIGIKLENHHKTLTGLD
ncbi:hypothetical protein LguiB_020679 [Lonicera macranthoides]